MRYNNEPFVIRYEFASMTEKGNVRVLYTLDIIDYENEYRRSSTATVFCNETLLPAPQRIPSDPRAK